MYVNCMHVGMDLIIKCYDGHVLDIKIMIRTDLRMPNRWRKKDVCSNTRLDQLLPFDKIDGPQISNP